MKSQIAAAALLAAFASSASAQGMKPGLWEITNKMQMSGAMGEQMKQAQAAMANMPPDQRKMMEEMMAKQGVKMGGGAGGMSLQVCMTKEMVERNEVPTGQQHGDCRTTSQSRSGNTMKMAFACTNPPSSGEGQVTFNSPESYNMKMLVNTQVQGRPEQMNMEASGKWMGADCGSVKPPMMPKK